MVAKENCKRFSELVSLIFAEEAILTLVRISRRKVAAHRVRIPIGWINKISIEKSLDVAQAFAALDCDFGLTFVI
jgi:hypothetical protein